MDNKNIENTEDNKKDIDLEQELAKLKEEQKEKDKKDRIKRIIMIIIILILLMFGLSKCSNNNQIDVGNGEKIEEPKEPIIDENGRKMIEIPSIDSTTLTKEQPYLYLVNPEHNQVYFKYIIMLDNKILYETEKFPPNRMVKANIYELLDSGEYNITANILTYDYETGDEQNTSRMNTTITVKK